MLVFWLSAGALLLLALVWIVPVLWRGRVEERADAKTLAEAVRARQLAELDADLAAGRITPEEHEHARAELQAQAIDGHGAGVTLQPAPAWFAAVTGVVIAAGAVGLYAWLGTPEAVTAHVAAAAPDEQTATMEALTAQLAERLEQEPDNLEGWRLLGRSYSALERFQEAAQAYAQAYALGGDRDPDLVAEYAEVLAYVQEGKFAGRPRELIEQALELNPQHPRALWLAGWAAFEAGDYEKALAHWRSLDALIPPEETEVHEALRQHMETAEARAGGAPAPSEQGAPPPPAAAAAGIEVEVRLDERLRARVAPDDTVFIFARAAGGPPMPLAVVRKRVRDLPLRVRLDDSMAMTPALRLSQFPAVDIVARISKSGGANARPGDLEGVAESVPVASSAPVAIEIDRVVNGD